MRKQECVHLHALLAEVTWFMVEREDLSASALDAYRAAEAQPSSIHESRRAHREAVFALATTIERELDSPSDELSDQLAE